jgi:hypothetical protein
MSNLKKKPQFILISGDIVDLKLDDNILFLPKPFSVSDVHKFFKNIS